MEQYPLALIAVREYLQTKREWLLTDAELALIAYETGADRTPEKLEACIRIAADRFIEAQLIFQTLETLGQR